MGEVTRTLTRQEREYITVAHKGDWGRMPLSMIRQFVEASSDLPGDTSVKVSDHSVYSGGVSLIIDITKDIE